MTTIHNNITQWIKCGEIDQIYYVGREAIAFAPRGNYIYFINLKTLENKIYTANSIESGDGVKCFCGHRNTNVFAFSENCPKPRVFVRTYPEFQLIYTLANEDDTEYCFLVFSEQVLLVGVGGVPNFGITVWSWRTGQKVAFEHSPIHEEQQKISCNMGHPSCLAQLGIKTTKVLIWDVFYSGTECILSSHNIHINRGQANFTSVVWTSEGGLYILDEAGCIFVVNQDHKLDKVIDYPEAQKLSLPTIVWYKSGMLVAGPDQSIRHYKKSGTWSCDWVMIPPEPVRKVTAARANYALVLTETSGVLQILDQENSFKDLIPSESKFLDFCIIHPTGEFIVTLRKEKYLELVNTATGEQVHQVVLLNNAAVVASSPLLPYLGVGFKTGHLVLYSAHDQKLTKFLSFYLTVNSITNVYFSENGRVIVAANLDMGQIFILSGIPGDEYKILTTLEIKTQIVDFITVSSKDCCRLFILPVTSDKYKAGNKIVRYCITGDNSYTVKDYVLQEDYYYYKLVAATTLREKRDRIFYAIPWGSKMIHQLETKKGHDIVNLTAKISTGHQLRKMYLKFDERHAITWSYDGFVIIRDQNFEKNVAIALPHHRYQCGVKKARIDPLAQYVVALGNNNILSCFKLNTFIDEDYAKELQKRLTDVTLLFAQPTQGLKIDQSLKNLPWIEVDKHMKAEAERFACQKERNAILKEFHLIQTELTELLEENLNGPDNEKLDILEFNLDSEKYECDVEENKRSCKAMSIYLKELAEANNHVAKWMIKTFSDPMKTKVTSIQAIFENFAVENYVIEPKAAEDAEKLQILREHKYVEDSLNDEVFRPWMTRPEDVVDLRTPTEMSDIVRVGSVVTAGSSHISKTSQLTEEYIYSFENSDCSKFIEVTHPVQDQREITTFKQVEWEYILAKHNIAKLKEFFNKRFEEMMSQKQKDLNTIKEKNARLRVVISELNFFLEKKVRATIIDPEFAEIENYERMIYVKDEEVGVLPYISPSEQALMDAQAAEAERIRLLLLADDFKERALVKMMNGVLEIRWEDELKKDVPKPKCMLEKEPEQFNEEDLKQIREYEGKVHELNEDREKYKNMLRAEFASTQNYIRDTIKKFNNRLKDLLVLKLKIQMCISEEDLVIFRGMLRHHSKDVMKQKERETERIIEQNEELIRDLTKMIENLHEPLNEFKSAIEAAQQRDKVLEKAFKVTFQDCPIGVQEQLAKQYRRRPKTSIKGINSAIILGILLQCVTTGERSISLTTECLDFLKGLDHLDNFTPPNIDEKLYAVVCKLRRQRVECEVTLRIAQAQLADAEATVAAFNKRLSEKRERNAELFSTQNELRQTFHSIIMDRQLQFVAPMGFVEISLSCNMSEFPDAILIPRTLVEDINAKIRKAGEEKLKQMQKALAFRKNIAIVEWQHQKLKMQIQDLKEKINDIDSARVTKDMLDYLRGKDLKTAIKPITFENEVELMKQSYEHTIMERKQAALNLMKEVNAIKANTNALNEKISQINVDVCHFQLQRDNQLEENEKTLQNARMDSLLERSNLVQQIQKNHGELLILQTELELQRLKTYPTLKFKFLK